MVAIIAPQTFMHGNQYYKPGVIPNVKYRLQRDPAEPDDSNCVRVLSPGDNAIVGNICRQYARDLATIMDNNPDKKYFAIREGKKPSNIYKIRVKLVQENDE